MDEKKKSLGKREIVLLGAVLAVALVFYLVNQIRYSAPAAFVEISIVDENSNRTVLEKFPLTENLEYTITTEPMNAEEPDGINQLVIQDGKAWISEANCPNHDCVKKGKISQNGEMLVCIPHRLTVSIVGE